MTFLSWRWVPISLVASSLCLHLLVAAAYGRKSDALAALTILPFWTWCLLGLGLLLPALFSRIRRVAQLLCLLWLLTLGIGSDETTALRHLSISELTPQPDHHTTFLRVATLNCEQFVGDPEELLKAYNPDIVFLQEVRGSSRIQNLTKALYGDKGDFRLDRQRAILIRGIIETEHTSTNLRSQHITARRHDGTPLELVNVHSAQAETRVDLWRPSCWRAHSRKRKIRRREIATTLALQQRASPHPDRPVILAGDFNSTPTDPAHGLLDKRFTNAFTAAGTGWGNTYHSLFPILRIDHIYATRQLTPLTAKVTPAPGTDHRMLIADFHITTNAQHAPADQ